MEITGSLIPTENPKTLAETQAVTEVALHEIKEKSPMTGVQNVFASQNGLIVQSESKALNVSEFQNETKAQSKPELRNAFEAKNARMDLMMEKDQKEADQFLIGCHHLRNAACCRDKEEEKVRAIASKDSMT